MNKVKLFGEEIAVRARIVNFPGLSSHADKDGLLKWISAFSPKPRHVFVVHGESQVTETYAQTLRDLGFSAHSPNYEEVYDLLADRMLAPGILRVRKPAAREDAAGSRAPSAAFLRLEQMGKQLIQLIAASRGRTNKDLAKFADQLKALIDKWDK